MPPKESTSASSPAQAFLPLTPLSAGILLAVAGGARHGYAIIKEIERQSGGRRAPGAGSLYAALRRMTDDGLLVEGEEADAAGAGPKRQYYGLTELGTQVARLEMRRLAELLRSASERNLIPGLRIAFPDEERR
jgi:DNA-binding PadR family transcriptional regulator